MTTGLLFLLMLARRIYINARTRYLHPHYKGLIGWCAPFILPHLYPHTHTYIHTYILRLIVLALVSTFNINPPFICNCSYPPPTCAPWILFCHRYDDTLVYIEQRMISQLKSLLHSIRWLNNAAVLMEIPLQQESLRRLLAFIHCIMFLHYHSCALFWIWWWSLCEIPRADAINKRHPTLTNTIVAPKVLPMIQDIHLFIFLWYMRILMHHLGWEKKAETREVLRTTIHSLLLIPYSV